MDELPDPSAASDTVKGQLSRIGANVVSLFSLTSWLPAVFLVGVIAVAIEVRSNPSKSLGDSFSSVFDQPAPADVGILILLVLGVIVTEALADEAIEFLEGHWARRRLLLSFTRWRVNRYERRIVVLRDRRLRALESAFDVALERVQDGPLGTHQDSAERMRLMRALTLVRERVLSWPTDSYSQAEQELADHIDWQTWSSSPYLMVLDACEQALNDYPARHRLLPTMLGNVLRATEDALPYSAEDLTMDKPASIPRLWLDEVSRYKNLLDMYSLLVIVFVLLAPMTAVLVSGKSILLGIWSAWTFIVLSVLAYRGAVAVARRYCIALRGIAQALTRAKNPEEAAKSDS